MKKLWLAAITSLVLLGGSFTAFSNPQQANYTPVIEDCVTQLFPLDGYEFVLACLPNGSSSCVRGFCNGHIR